MSNYNNLKTSIDANIKQNGNQEITGPILNSVLNQMVNILGTGYQFAGVATLDPATEPGTPDAKVFYIANGKGTYTNFGGLEVTEDDVVVLYWDTAWHKVATGIASQAKLSELDKEINGCEAISIVDENVPWEQKLDKKVNVSAYKGKTIKVKTSSDNIETSYKFNLYIMTDIYSSSIIETRGLHVGDSTEIEITEDINYIWLYNSYVQGTGKTLYVQIYIDGVKGLADDIVEIKESTLSNVLKIEQTETQIKVSNKNPKGNTTTIMFEPFGVNNLWQIRSVEIYDSSDNLLVKSTTDTDSIGPYQVGAVNNADGDNIGTAVADFTGGCHGYNGDQTGSATASSSVKVNSLNGILDVVVTNRIQGYNTRKANGTGREIIVEEVHYVFESGVDGFKVNNFIKALEEVTIKLYYGMQIAFARDFVKFNSGEIGKWKGQSLNAYYDGDFIDSVVGKGNNGLMQKMYVLDRGLGHFAFVPSNISRAFQRGKIYYNLIRQNVTLEENDTLFFEGGYIFDFVE